MRISDWSSDVCSSDLVFLAQRLQPLANARGERRLIEEQPRLIQNQQRGRTVETLIEAGEQVAQHRLHGGGAVHQFFHLEALYVTEAETIGVRVQQLAVRAAEHVGRECLPQRDRKSTRLNSSH